MAALRVSLRVGTRTAPASLLRLMSSSNGPRLYIGIETSCDDTSVALVSSRREILSQVTRSQWDVHKEHGGIVPNLAARAHEENVMFTVDEAIRSAGVNVKDVDAVAVTVGPGMAPCLRVGLLAAKALALGAGVPVIGVHHMEGHLLTPRLADGIESCPFPFLSLLVSGGHTMMVVAHAPGKYTELGTTYDDAIGEAYDKTGRLLGLDISNAGAEIERLAKRAQVRHGGRPGKYTFTEPLTKREQSNLDFSYGGLKAAVARVVEKGADVTDPETVEELAYGFQTAALNHLVTRVRSGLRWCAGHNVPVASLVVCGGVACNMELRRLLGDEVAAVRLPMVAAPKELCRDNGAMIAWAGHERWLQKGPGWAGDGMGLSFTARWPLGPRAPDADPFPRDLPPVASPYPEER